MARGKKRAFEFSFKGTGPHAAWGELITPREFGAGVVGIATVPPTAPSAAANSGNEK